jgi:hypothetical protein
MGDSVRLGAQLRASIEDDIALRRKAHREKIARLRTARSSLRAAGATTTTKPLVMLAHGDSWFDYPLSGNSPCLGTTDVIEQLESMGNVNPVVLNVSHHGDATTDEMSLPKQKRMIESLEDPSNWLDGGKPDAILFSGGGNDIAGDQFCIFLDYATTGSNGLDPVRFQKALSMVEASYLDLFAFRDHYAPGVPVFAHCYDFAIPNGAHPSCIGPWLKPSLDYMGWDLAQGTVIVRQALTAFKALLDGLARVAANGFVLVNTQGLLSPSDWANELHPYPEGFRTVAAEFVAALGAHFPGRI